MPTRNINLTDHFDRFVQKQIKAGTYRNVSEVMRAGLRLLEEETREEQEKLKMLQYIATEAFHKLDQGAGLDFNSKEQLAAFIEKIGNRSTRKVNTRAGK